MDRFRDIAEGWGGGEKRSPTPVLKEFMEANMSYQIVVLY